MRFIRRNREPRAALLVGGFMAVASAMVFAIGIILDLGGGSITRGWTPGMQYLGFYAAVLIPAFFIAGLLAAGLTRLFGVLVVVVACSVGLVSILGHSIVTSRPGVQLSRVTGSTGIPDLEFERFDQGHSLSEGTSYFWVARCSQEEADLLVTALGMKNIPMEVRTGSEAVSTTRHRAVGAYLSVFGGSTEGVDFYVDHRGIVGGYSPSDGRFRLFWWPAVYAE